MLKQLNKMAKVYAAELQRVRPILWRALQEKFANLNGSVFECAWQDAVREAQAEMLKRLITSFIFEGIISGKKIDCREVVGYFRDPKDPPPEHVYEFNCGEFQIIIPLRARTHFARVKTYNFVLLKTPQNGTRKIFYPMALYGLVLFSNNHSHISKSNIEATAAAILNSLMNLICAICYKIVKRNLKKSVRFEKSDAINALIFYEQLVTTGHPVHPLTKYRSNFSIEESLRIAPDFENRIAIGFVAVKREFLRISSIDKGNFQNWLDPTVKAQIISALAAVAKPDQYAFIPVHCWQYQNWLHRKFKDDIKNKDIIPLGHDFMTADPSLSLRTLYVGSAPGDFFLKLPVNLQTTSYLRTVSPNAVHNGVALARICKTLMGRHAVLSEKTGFLLETEGAFFSKKSSQDMTMDDIMLSKHLGYIVRQSPYDIIGPDEVPIVTAALTDPNRFSDRLPLHDLVDKFGASLPENDKGHAPEMWFRAFLEVSVEGLLTLLSGYGIGFEAHGQNTLTVVTRDSGRPVRLLLRDFGGIRVSLDRLRKRGLEPDFFQESVTVKDTMKEVTNKLYYAFFQSVLGELVAELSWQYRINEMRLWQLVYQCAAGIFQKLKKGHPYPDWVDADYAKFTKKEWNFKSLLSMSLLDYDADYVYTALQNPLHEIHHAMTNRDIQSSFPVSISKLPSKQ